MEKREQLDSLSGGLSLMALFTLIWSVMAEIALAGRDYWIGGIVFFPVVLVFLFFYWKFHSIVRQLAAAEGGMSHAGGPTAVAKDAGSLQVAKQETPEEKVRDRRFLIIFFTEGLSILVVKNVLANTGLDHLFFPCFALIVGLHFFPLGKLFGRKFDYYIGVWTSLVALTALILAINRTVPGYQVTAMTGIGCAIATSLYGLKFILAGRKIAVAPVLSFFILLSFLSAQPAFSQEPPAPYGPLPTPAQLSWHEMEMYCLIHFGVDTYTDKEWGYGDEDPAIFNPAHFDAAQIVGAAKAGGFKGVVVVAKHHDGFCLWPTGTTEHNITKSPWKNGQGDMVKEYQEACQKLGMRLGLYCSPWDRNNPNYGKPEYVNIYRAQVKELYTHYGPLFISWHDGANGGDGYYGGARELRKIDRTSYYGWDTTWAMIRKLQPSAVLFGDVGPDVRWVGNEEGHAGATCWATYTPRAPDADKRPSNGYVISEEGTEGTRKGEYWMPAECDVSLRPGWFYHEAQDGHVKSPDVLLDLYYKSVGRGAGLDVGLSPNRQGLISEGDVGSLRQFGEYLKATFSVNLANGARLTASNTRGNNSAKFGPAFLLDNDRYSYWATDDAVRTPQLIVDLPGRRTFNVIRLRENIKLGQRIDSFAVDLFEDHRWKEIASATSIGSNRLIRLPRNISAIKLRLRITGAAACIALSDFGLFLEPVHKSGRPTGRRYGLSKAGWKILPGLLAADPAFAIDEKESTVFSTLKDAPDSAAFPQEIAVDMGKVQTIKAFTYLPRQDKRTEGVADKYIYSISTDGRRWEQVAAGEFSNIRANPVEQVTQLGHAVSARYFKLTVLHVLSGYGVTVAELGGQ